jgi:hypothetical protein
MMSAIDRTAGLEALKRPVGRERRAVRSFQTPVVREIAPVAHGAAGSEFGRHQVHRVLDRR